MSTIYKVGVLNVIKGGATLLFTQDFDLILFVHDLRLLKGTPKNKSNIQMGNNLLNV